MRMGSQGGGFGGGAVPLSRQGSLYGLTLDEVQSQLGGLGKPLGSMNLDELLKSVWSVEANQGPNAGAADPEGMQSGLLAPLQRQPSYTLSRALSKKTVDEVWKDIQQGEIDDGSDKSKKKKKDSGPGDQDPKPSLGEMTLEDFLHKAGVVAESPVIDMNGSHVLGVDSVNSGGPQSAQWMHYQLPSVQPQQNVVPVFIPGHHVVQHPVPIIASPFLDSAFGDAAQMTVSPSSLLGTLSDTPTSRRKRVAPGDVVEKTVERRQKRMIKNRESAARSRARKEAYTQELENKVSRLEEENERLRRKLEAEKVLPSTPPAEPKNQLRRTSSAPL
ncbi:ABSCISIC ACID-INSENSITIVE 5-like protein 2 isoform X1 [Syzygium oleosum]|uniref:ABSCISIC ACID-INSENSITIVE 5-like protein 2 isoform X1 n=1 Tax=Syzygium oleosum TaxID=219896 RepID=UPI0024BA0FE9|nr:ABSCISIC ACID-INSENSITIVE 5-like protein 2 isoform X1 [Syzygium oleosum]